MWCYVKTLQFPVNLKCSDLNMAKLLITQFGGPDGELSAALRYLSQRFSMPTNKSKGMLNDIGTEEMAHVEIISTMVYQIMENATIDEIKKAIYEYEQQYGPLINFGLAYMQNPKAWIDTPWPWEKCKDGE